MLTDFETQWRFEREKEQQRVTEQKSDWLNTLAEAGVLLAVAEYDGANDEGWIESVELYDRAGEAATLLAASGSDRYPAPENSLIDQVWGWTYEVLTAFHGGWEINEGAAGSLRFDVLASEIVVDHGIRFESYEHHQTVV